MTTAQTDRYLMLMWSAQANLVKAKLNAENLLRMKLGTDILFALLIPESLGSILGDPKFLAEIILFSDIGRTSLWIGDSLALLIVCTALKGKWIVTRTNQILGSGKLALQKNWRHCFPDKWMILIMLPTAAGIETHLLVIRVNLLQNAIKISDYFTFLEIVTIKRF